jgi:outer membrane immunogenic protein
MSRILYAAAAFLAGTSLTFAADLPSRAVTPAPYVAAPAFSWTGFYVGGQLGYGWGSLRDHNNPFADRKEIDGFVGGLQGGYNYQLPSNIVLGAEASILFADAKKNWNGWDTSPYDGYYTTDRLNVLGTVRARVGYSFDRFLPYVTGGLAIANTEHSLGCSRAFIDPASGSCLRGGQFHNSGSDTSFGYVIGGGLEYAVTSNWSAKVEYLYTDLGQNDVHLADPNFPAAVSDRKFKTRFSTVTFGVNYRF